MRKSYPHIILFSLFWLIIFPVFSQTPNTYWDQKQQTISGYNLNIKLASNSLSTNFAKALYEGAYLNNDMKAAVLDKLHKDNNLTGFRQNSDLFINFPLNDSSWKASVHYTSTKVREMRFSKSAFELAFLGNENSIGQAYPFHLHFRSLDYESFRIGLKKKWERQFAGLEFGVVSGSYYLDSRIKNAEIYTAGDGSYVDLKMKAKLDWSNEEQGKNIWQGTGLVADLYWGVRTEKRQLFVQLDDWGVINFNNSDLTGAIDSSWRFNGLSWNFFREKEPAFFSFNKDSLKKWSGISQGGNIRVFLPSSINLFAEQNFNRLGIGFWGQYHFHSMAGPRISIRPSYRLDNSWQIAGSFSHGGYGSFRTGLHVEADFSHSRFGFKAGSYNIGGVFMEEAPAAIDFYFTIYKY